MHKLETTALTPTSKPVKLNLKLVLSWLFVGIPLFWGVLQVLYKSAAFFKH